MPKLYIQRHLQSQWNKENRFTGWTDVPLSEEGIASAKDVAQLFYNSEIDAVYTSPLKRNKETASLILKNLNKTDLPIIVNKSLDERNYGELTGLNKDEVKKKFGEEKVQIWRRSYTEAPPGGESGKDVFERVVPFFKNNIEKDLIEGKNILVVASHNSLRALVKYIEDISDEKFSELEISFGGLISYEFDKGEYKRI